jgi:5-oxoprolinase (ATP-hydrolysing)
MTDQSKDILWKFWIDVGGTFTDCLAQNQVTHEFVQTKILSSGLTQGRLLFGSQGFLVETGFGDGFWTGAKFRVLCDSGNVIDSSAVTGYDSESGRLQLDSIEADDGHRYELDSGLPAPIIAIHRLLKIPLQQPLPAFAVHLGTTRGTNALLTRSGAKTALVTTKGFRDLLLIGDQARPHLFELTVVKPEPLFSTTIEVDERILADGKIESVPDNGEIKRDLMQLKLAGVESIAVCLMHGFKFPEHEKIVGEIARELGFADVRLSSDVAPLIKIVSRAETTVLDAYLNPVLGNYLDQIQGNLSAGSELQLMTSAGGLVDRESFSGKDSVLSGPAGGIVGAARVAEQAGFDKVLTFDMGGTSSDVGRYDGVIDLEYETRKSDVRIMTPMVAIETVAAGGGSICWFDGTRLVVGPQSASSDPGPACYGRGGPLAVTDINLFLGRLVVDRFPFSLNIEAVEKRLTEVQDQMRTAGFQMSLREIANGFLEIANQNMASAVRSISIAKGYDPKEYVLVAFGGAGPQHACAVADAIGIQRILDHPQGSILSAVGIRLADQTSHLARSILQLLDVESLAEAEKAWGLMKSDLAEQLSIGDESEKIEWTFSLDLRYQGTNSSLNVSLTDSHSTLSVAQFQSEFEQQHLRLFGFNSDRNLELVVARAEGRKIGNRLSRSPRSGDSVKTLVGSSGTRLSECSVPIFDREQVQPDHRIVGPAMIASDLSTTIVDQGWQATMLADRQLLLERIEDCPDELTAESARSTTVDPIQLEIFNNHFSTIARQMGIVLQKTSMSVNVKERLDFSCAIFTQTGDLVVNAPHIPVHLGAMSETVRGIIRANESVYPGDVFVTNDPFAGGSHLPDVTVVTPVFDEDGDLLFWVASRSHHSEIGGISPGSMPARATNLAQEGVLIRNFQLVDGRKSTERFDALESLLNSGPYPSRAPQENLADIRAQVASNRSGEKDLLELVRLRSKSIVLAYTQHIQDAAESKIRRSLLEMVDGVYSFEDALDNGATIRVTIEKKADSLRIDFAGTDSVLTDNLNANPAIVSSAIIYVMRCLIDEAIPLNEGVMKPVTVRLPECFLNPTSHEDPAKCPAVVGGNVETSQRVVDVLLGALQKSLPETGLAAASQGTMNNWLMGDDSFGYYETIGGGSGATSQSGGADAVHTHMTNTRLTDPEVLETRYPAVLREFAIRADSGGSGEHCGGNGMIREVEFLKPLTVSLLTNRRTLEPYGILGGQSGKAGKNVLIKRTSGQVVELNSSCQLEVQPGDRLRIETPGGGGWG